MTLARVFASAVEVGDTVYDDAEELRILAVETVERRWLVCTVKLHGHLTKRTFHVDELLWCDSAP